MSAKYWLTQVDPRTSHLYKCFRFLFIVVNITFFATIFLKAGIPPFNNEPIPNSIIYVGIGITAVMLNIWSTARNKVKSKSAGNDDAENNVDNVDIERKDNFPGWVIVIFDLYVTWLIALLEYYDVLTGLTFKLPSLILYPSVLIILAIFFSSESHKKKIALGVKNGLMSIVDTYIQKFTESMVRSFAKSETFSKAVNDVRDAVDQKK